jgi:hypothetical protein
MGCHTWFYNCVKPTIKNIKLDFTFKPNFDLFLKSELDIDFQNMHLEYLFGKKVDVKDVIAKTYKNAYKKFKKQLKAEIKKSKYNYWGTIDNLYLRSSNEIIKRNHLFTKIKIYGRKQNVIELQEVEYHDIFRTSGSCRYTSTILYSLEETLLFIDTNNLDVSVGAKDRVIEFWNKYPNGIIEFG